MLGLDDEESIGNEETKLDGKVRTINRHPGRHLPIHFRDGQGHEELERVKQLGNGWCGELIDRKFLEHVLIREQILRDFTLSLCLFLLGGQWKQQRGEAS